MKMFMPLKVQETGILNWDINEGATLAPGDLLATLELDNPENVSTAVLFEGDMEVSGWGESFAPSNTKRPHLMFRKAIASLTGGMAGYVLTKEALQYAMETLHMAVTNPTLPVFEIDEQLSVLSGRMDPKLFHKISLSLGDFKTLCEDETNQGLPLRYVVLRQPAALCFNVSLFAIDNVLIFMYRDCCLSWHFLLTLFGTDFQPKRLRVC
jgi:acetyl-CoA carboxylase/biotin carboxylase 1